VSLLLVILPISGGKRLIYPLETRFSKPANMNGVDEIIVLAGGVNRKQSIFQKDIQFNNQAERDVKILELGLAYPESKLMHVEGSSSLKFISDRERDFYFGVIF